MDSISSAALLIQQARAHAQLTQRELAERVGTSQSAIAKLEKGESNPTIDTLARCAEAAGLSLHLTLAPARISDPVVERYKRDVDRTLLRENLRTSVHERLRSLGEWQTDLHTLHYAVTKARAKKVAEASPKEAP